VLNVTCPVPIDSFLYSFTGRTIFLVVVSTVCFTQEFSAVKVGGGIFLLLALYNWKVIYDYPELEEYRSDDRPGFHELDNDDWAEYGEAKQGSKKGDTSSRVSWADVSESTTTVANNVSHVSEVSSLLQKVNLPSQNA